MDISADLEELAHTPVMVVCAGAKSILDLGLTLEYLETHGVPVIGYGTDELPAFYTRRSGFGVDYRMDSPEELAAAFHTSLELGFRGGMLVTNPIPEEYSMDPDHPLPAGQGEGAHRRRQSGQQHPAGVQQRPPGGAHRRRAGGTEVKKVGVDAGRCVGCGACVRACPLGVLELDGGKAAVNERRHCMECLHCAAACPTRAVTWQGLAPEALYRAMPEDPVVRAVELRRSTRHFRPDCPERAALTRVLDQAEYAPSSKNGRWFWGGIRPMPSSPRWRRGGRPTAARSWRSSWSGGST